MATGTNTGIGETAVSAGLANLLGGNYWRPVQAGLKGKTDIQPVARLGRLPPDYIAPELYRLKHLSRQNCRRALVGRNDFKP
ncbi:AAA family ATPase [Bradyrhizobium sp. CCBAU 11386]|uniref:AAA family ATPase n=1 Tax=Bradyrhizobium sp. CCBAU 11386 TaxID=1630837 RepID=UPI003FA404F6